MSDTTIRECIHCGKPVIGIANLHRHEKACKAKLCKDCKEIGCLNKLPFFLKCPKR